MPPHFARPIFALLPTALAVYALGCGSDSNLGVDGGGFDSGPTDGATHDAEMDAGVDAHGDSGLDAGAEPLLPDGVTLSGLELYQAVQIPLMADGAELPRTTPIVANRDALMRAYVTLSGPAPAGLRAELLIEAADGTTTRVRADGPLTSPSRVEDAASTFNLHIPAAAMTPSARYRLRLLSDDGAPAPATGTHDARYPRDGSLATLGAEADEGGIDLVLVPLRYLYDGSGRLPDTSPAQLALFEELLTALYPISEVHIRVREPVDWTDGPQLFTGNFDFGQLNGFLRDLKTSDGAPSASYYYALVQPAPTFSDYCGRSCTTGQSFVVSDPTNGAQRAGGGMGYSGERWAWTLAHELGHMHGRNHAPCNVRRSDPDFPYPGGKIGLWGYDRRSETFLDPSVATDMMGYCDDEWISDYTYDALFDRVLAVHRAAVSARVDTPTDADVVCTSSMTPEGARCDCAATH